ncbi:MAG: chromosome partition protein MukE [Bacteroidetes bacterium]|nr:chromosome partition protein MukE [Bacteroidota bacterium]
MEDAAKKYSFLETEEADNLFAELDFALKSGQHVQNYPHQVELYNFLEKFEEDIRLYYRNLFKVNLAAKGSDYTRYFYLEIDDESRGIVKSRSKKLSPEYTLLGILLLKIHRIDKYFINDIYIPDLIQLIKSNEEYKNFIYNLFAKRREKEATDIDENTIDEWVRNALQNFERMGWIHFDPRNKDIFEIMPSIDRLFTMYSYEIHNIDRLIDETNTITEKTGGLYPVEEGEDNE